MKKYDQLLDFLLLAEKLKTTLRYGANELMPIKESSAEHSWKVALTAMILAEEFDLKLDLAKILQMALVHDLVEAIAGDTDCRDVVEGRASKDQKQKDEEKAIELFKKSLPDKSGQLVSDLWHEYEGAKTKESLFIKAVDKIETTIGLINYGWETYDRPDLIAIYPNKHFAKLDQPEMNEFLSAVKKELKKEFEKGDFPWLEEYQFTSIQLN